MIVVENLTRRRVAQRHVIVVNDHFTGGCRGSKRAARLNAPLSQFQTAFGQQFDRGRQSVFKVEVTATRTRWEAGDAARGANRCNDK